MFKKSLLVLAALALSVGSASAVTIADINANGGSITFGDKTFSNFSVAGLSESAVTVSSIVEGNTIGIVFNANWLVTEGEADFGLSYKVTVNDPAWLISSIGQAVTASVGNPLAYVQIDESVWANGFSVQPLIGKSTISVPGDSVDPNGEFSDILVLVDDADLPSDQRTPTPVKEAWVTKDIFLRAGDGWEEYCRSEEIQGCQGFASSTQITQRFFQTPNDDVPPVPEPATMLLFSTALLGLGFMRRKKS